MKKLVLLGIGNFQNFNYYIFKKDKMLLEKLESLFKKLLDIYAPLSYEEDTNKKRDIFKLKDKHESLGEKSSRVDIFYGNKKVYVTIVCKDEKRLKFNDSLGKITKMPNPKKFAKKRKNGKKI